MNPSRPNKENASPNLPLAKELDKPDPLPKGFVRCFRYRGQNYEIIDEYKALNDRTRRVELIYRCLNRHGLTVRFSAQAPGAVVHWAKPTRESTKDMLKRAGLKSVDGANVDTAQIIAETVKALGVDPATLPTIREKTGSSVG